MLSVVKTALCCKLDTFHENVQGVLKNLALKAAYSRLFRTKAEGISFPDNGVAKGKEDYET